MPRELRKHVVEEADSGCYIVFPRPIEHDRALNVGFVCFSVEGSFASCVLRHRCLPVGYSLARVVAVREGNGGGAPR